MTAAGPAGEAGVRRRPKYIAGVTFTLLSPALTKHVSAVPKTQAER